MEEGPRGLQSSGLPCSARIHGSLSTSRDHQRKLLHSPSLRIFISDGPAAVPFIPFQTRVFVVVVVVVEEDRAGGEVGDVVRLGCICCSAVVSWPGMK